ncbi:MAG: hypothetical protein LLF94_05935 [Chlamydiales bacterium]|nr:hypothetical protein [Chlamydiales bacterium]
MDDKAYRLNMLEPAEFDELNAKSKEMSEKLSELTPSNTLIAETVFITVVLPKLIDKCYEELERMSLLLEEIRDDVKLRNQSTQKLP